MSNVPIVFEGYKIKKIDFEFCEEIEEDDGRFEVSAKVDDTRTRAELTITNFIQELSSQRKIEIQISGIFEINDSSNIESYLRVNAVAILFPYVRSIVSMITSLDASSSIVLPTINFTEMGK